MSEETITEKKSTSPGAAVVRADIAEVFSDIFQFEGEVRFDTSHEDVERWDSLQHIALIAGLESTFGVSLSMDEMMEIGCVADIHTVLGRHGV